MLRELTLNNNELTGILFPLLPLIWMKGETCFAYVLSHMVFVCFDCVLYALGPIPAELGQLAKLSELRLNDNKLTGTLSPLLLLTCVADEVGDLPCVSPIVPVG
jgi:hypothetical protein